MANCCQVLGGSEVSGNPIPIMPTLYSLVNAHQQDSFWFACMNCRSVSRPDKDGVAN